MALRVPVTFLPADVTVWVDQGATILEATRQAGVLIAAPCGGRGTCGSCGVRIVSGSVSAPDAEEVAGLARAPGNVRLACRARVDAAVCVRPLAIARGEAVAERKAEGGRLVAGVDLGTTSVAALVVEEASGREIARAVAPNRQQSYGADVISRLGAAVSGSAEDLRRLAVSSVADALRSAVSRAGRDVADIGRVVVAGNSAMAGIFTGASVDSLATAPFEAPEFGGAVPDSGGLGDVVASGAEVVVVPPIAGFVGGDALAAALHAGLYDADTPKLVIDFGTNAEVLLAGVGRLRVASAAAGPAFEGGGLTCGGPAVEGAVERVSISSDGRVELQTIGGAEPIWLSGAGLVSAVAALRAVGHVASDGLFIADGPLRERFTRDEQGVLSVDLTGGSGAVAITQLDVRALQLAKSAIRVAIDSVLRDAGVRAGDLSSIGIAGAFGAALEPNDLESLGVLPEGVAARVVQLGNASLMGAAVIALDPATLVQAERIANHAVHVELTSLPHFQEAFLSAGAFAPFTTAD